VGPPLLQTPLQQLPIPLNFPHDHFRHVGQHIAALGVKGSRHFVNDASANKAGRHIRAVPPCSLSNQAAPLNNPLLAAPHWPSCHMAASGNTISERAEACVCVLTCADVIVWLCA
jgi:small neutral amino acid transporter SnatA (MarC family)